MTSLLAIYENIFDLFPFSSWFDERLTEYSTITVLLILMQWILNLKKNWIPDWIKLVTIYTFKTLKSDRSNIF